MFILSPSRPNIKCLLLDEKHMDLYVLDLLCFFWTLERVNNYIKEKSISEKDQLSSLMLIQLNNYDVTTVTLYVQSEFSGS